MDLDKEQRKLVNVSGIAQAAEEENQVYFVHFTFQEYFQAKAIVTSKFHPKNENFAKKFVWPYSKNDPLWQFLAPYLGRKETFDDDETRANVKKAFKSENGFRCVCCLGSLHLYEVVKFDAVEVKKWAFNGYYVTYMPFMWAISSNSELAEKIWEIVKEGNFPELEDLFHWAKPIPVKWVRKLLSKYPGWSEDIHLYFFRFMKMENAAHLMNEMSDKEVDNFFARHTEELLLEGLDSAQKRQFAFPLSQVIKSKNNEERWERWCQLRDYVSKDFCYRDPWGGKRSMAHVACEKNDAKLLLDLRDRQFPLDKEDKRGKMPIHLAKKFEVFSMMLRFATEDAGLGEYFVPLDGPEAEERPPEIHEKVEDLLCLKIFHKEIKAERLMLLLKNVFGHLYVKTKVFELERIKYDVKVEKKEDSKPRNKSDWDKVKRIARKWAPGFEEKVCVVIYLVNVLGELFINEEETGKKRTKEDQGLCEELLLILDIPNYKWQMTDVLGEFYVPRPGKYKERMDEEQNWVETKMFEFLDSSSDFWKSTSFESGCVLRNLLAELYVPENGKYKKRTEEEQIRVERILSTTNEKGWPPLIIDASYRRAFESLLRNLLGSEFRSEREEPKIPEWQWNFMGWLNVHHDKKTTLSEFCYLIEAKGLKVPVLVENIPEGCQIREHAKPFIWRNKLLAVGIRNWKMPDDENTTEERPQSDDLSEAGPSNSRLRKNKLCTLL
jgi:hypothetical protein